MADPNAYSGPNFVNFNADTGDFARHCASYENFNIKPSAYYDIDRISAAGHLHVMTAFGQGVLLNCEMSSMMAQVRLADSGDIIPVPAHQITLHAKHRIPTFAEFMAAREAQRERQCNMESNNNAGMTGIANNLGFKRDRPASSAASSAYPSAFSSYRSSGSSCSSGSCVSSAGSPDSVSPENNNATSSCEESYDSVYDRASAAHAKGLNRLAPNQFNF